MQCDFQEYVKNIGPWLMAYTGVFVSLGQPHQCSDPPMGKYNKKRSKVEGRGGGDIPCKRKKPGYEILL
jgi:hypothetical protein